MKTVRYDSKLPIKFWLDDLEDSANNQAINLSKLPFAFKHIAIMPDAHMGYGMPIGGVLTTKKVVIPNAVGVDIGCGMYAVRTNVIAESVKRSDLLVIRDYIKALVPVGFKHQSKPKDYSLMPNNGSISGTPIVSQQFKSACSQLGTLGGGNHFIELQSGDDGFLWLMIHSGSRNLGKQVADYYNKLAIKLNSKWFSSVLKEHELAFLPIDSDEGKQYLREMEYCVQFAYHNRREMMRVVKEAISNIFPATVFTMGISSVHNFAQMENHFKSNVMVHRKGATEAYLNKEVIIPGSQGSSSYIARGLGNVDSFRSCSHGAGRVLGRKEAQRVLDYDAELKIMEDQHIIHNMSPDNLDESVSAYKDIDTVMENQKDLVEIVTKLKPILSIKG